MHFHKVNTGILPLIFIVVLFKITGIESVDNQQQKGKQEVGSTEFDYGDEGEPEVPTNNDATTAKPNSATEPFFESEYNIVYYTHEGENVTFNCAPKNFNEVLHSIAWYRDNMIITNGNTTLVAGNYDVDNKHSLTIYNFTSAETGKFHCAVLPADKRQFVKVELKAPDNLSEANAAARGTLDYLQLLGLMTISAAASLLY